MPRKHELSSLRHHGLQECPRFVLQTQDNSNVHSNKQCLAASRLHQTRQLFIGDIKYPQTPVWKAPCPLITCPPGPKLLCKWQWTPLFFETDDCALTSGYLGKVWSDCFFKGPEAKAILSCWSGLFPQWETETTFDPAEARISPAHKHMTLDSRNWFRSRSFLFTYALSKKHWLKPGRVERGCNPRDWEAEFQKLKAILGFKRTYLKKKKKLKQLSDSWTLAWLVV